MIYTVFFSVELVIGLVVGFEPSEYSVIENQTEVSLTVRILSGISATYVELQVTLMNGTATVEEDFETLPDDIGLIFFTPFRYDDEDTFQQTLPVRILNDALFEGTETFTALLTSYAYINFNPNITLDPSSAIVNIIDDDGMYHSNCRCLNSWMDV